MQLLSSVPLLHYQGRHSSEPDIQRHLVGSRFSSTKPPVVQHQQQHSSPPASLPSLIQPTTNSCYENGCDYQTTSSSNLATNNCSNFEANSPQQHHTTTYQLSPSVIQPAAVYSFGGNLSPAASSQTVVSPTIPPYSAATINAYGGYASPRAVSSASPAGLLYTSPPGQAGQGSVSTDSGQLTGSPTSQPAGPSSSASTPPGSSPIGQGSVSTLRFLAGSDGDEALPTGGAGHASNYSCDVGTVSETLLRHNTSTTNIGDSQKRDQVAVPARQTGIYRTGTLQKLPSS